MENNRQVVYSLKCINYRLSHDDKFVWYCIDKYKKQRAIENLALSSLILFEIIKHLWFSSRFPYFSDSCGVFLHLSI